MAITAVGGRIIKVSSKGEQGPAGDQGIQGIQGDQGTQGDQGDTGAAGVWGDLIGDITDQTDLQAILDTKLASVVTAAGLTGLGTAASPLNIAGLRVIAEPSDWEEYGTKDGTVFKPTVGNYLIAGIHSYGGDSIEFQGENGIATLYGSFGAMSYTGSTPFITFADTGMSIDIIKIFISTPNATAVKMVNFNSCIMHFPVFSNCQKTIDLDTGGFFTTEILVMVDSGDGCTVKDVGTISARLIQWSVGKNTGGKALTLSGAASERCFMIMIDSRPESTECFADIQNSYAGVIDWVSGVHTTGGGDFFFNRDQDDVNVVLAHVQNVTSSHSTIAVHIADGDELSTTIIDDTAVTVAGTYTTDVAKRFTRSGAVCTYIGNETRIFPVSMKTLCTNASGNNRDYDLFILKNGSTLIPITLDKVNCDAGTPAKAHCIGSVELSTNNTLQVVAIGRGTANNALTCSALAFIIG